MNYLIPSKKRLQLVVSWYLKNGWTKKEMSLFRSIWYIRALDKENSPMVYQLQLKGLDLNSDGLYSFKDVCTRFEKAITAYDDIK